MHSEISNIISYLENLIGFNCDINNLIKLQNIKVNFSNIQQTEQFGQYSKANILKEISDYQQKHPNTPDNIKISLHKILLLLEECDNHQHPIIQKLTALINEYKNILSKNEIKDLQKILDKIKI